MYLVAGTHIIYIHKKTIHEDFSFAALLQSLSLHLSPCGCGRLYVSHDVDLLFVSLPFATSFWLVGMGKRGTASVNKSSCNRKGPPNKLIPAQVRVTLLLASKRMSSDQEYIHSTYTMSRNDLYSFMNKVRYSGI